MKKILMATGNLHKISEVKDILNSLNVEVEIVSPKQLDPGCDEPVEDGKTFKDNSYIKAKYYHDLFNLPTIADDSGICIDYYDGAPGIYSARWMPELSYEEKNKKITDDLKGSDNRGAQFVCGITYIDELGNVSYHEGVLEGKIADAPSGTKGFGYDPVFVMNGQELTMADLGEEFKKYNSHRALALRKLVESLEK